jgi:hypothetical protein
MRFNELITNAKLIVAGILLLALLYAGQAAIKRTHCVEGTNRCVTIKGPWVRVESVQQPGEIVLVEKWWLVGRRGQSAKFVFFDEPLGLRGRAERFSWGTAEHLLPGERVHGRRFDGEVNYLRSCELVFSCGFGPRCTSEIVEIRC